MKTDHILYMLGLLSFTGAIYFDLEQSELLVSLVVLFAPVLIYELLKPTNYEKLILKNEYLEVIQGYSSFKVSWDSIDEIRYSSWVDSPIGHEEIIHIIDSTIQHRHSFTFEFPDKIRLIRALNKKFNICKAELKKKIQSNRDGHCVLYKKT